MNRQRAFTLVEMIVALAVTSVLTVLMLRMFIDSSTIWKREDDRLDTFREARAALQLMASELSTVNPVPEAPEKFPALALVYHEETPGADQTTPGNQEIYALANLPNRGKSSLCAIGYFCEWREEKTELSDSKNCFVLRRQFADSDTTFPRLQAALKPSAPPSSLNTLYERKPVETLQDVASYIWDLQFALPVPAPTTAKPNPIAPSWPQGIFARELPEWVEIRFKALGSAGARKLAGQNLSRTTWFQPKDSAYQRFILPGEQQFVTRVKLSR